MPKCDLFRFSTNLAYLALFGSIITIAGYVSYIPLLVLGAAFIYGVLSDNQRLKTRPLDPRIILVFIFTSLVISLFRLDLEHLFDRVLGVLLIIIGAKLVSPKKQRDILQIYLLNLFLVASAALIRFGIEFGLLMLVEAFVSITGVILVYGSIKQKEILYSDLRAIFRFSGLVTLALIPGTIIFFIIIPRPSWTIFAWGGGVEGRTGFSDRVTPGDVEQIKIDRTPAFRVKWLSGPRPMNPLWRGIVYEAYRQGGWEKDQAEEVAFPFIRENIMEYEVLLEPSGLRYLPGLGLPVRVDIQRRRSNLITGYTIYVHQVVDRRLLYRVRSSARAFIPADIDPENYLSLPSELKNQIWPIAAGFLSQSNQVTARQMETHLKTRFRYSLRPGGGEGDPIIRFLTQTREGHCEYFATAMALMLRSLDIPARVVGGYLGGDWNELGQYYLVHQSDAHTWVEVFVPDQGWLAFDPTPAADLVEGSDLIKKMARLVDYVRYRWYTWVMQYDLQKQIGLARKASSLFHSLKSRQGLKGLEVKLPPRNWVIALFVLMSLFIGLRVMTSYLARRPKTAVQKFIQFFEQKGFEKRRGETMREFVQRLDLADDLVHEKASRFISCYYDQEFGHQKDPDNLDHLLAEIKVSLKDSPQLNKSSPGRSLN